MSPIVKTQDRGGVCEDGERRYMSIRLPRDGMKSHLYTCQFHSFTDAGTHVAEALLLMRSHAEHADWLRRRAPNPRNSRTGEGITRGLLTKRRNQIGVEHRSLQKVLGDSG